MSYPQYQSYSQREKVAQKEKVTATKSQLSYGNIYLWVISDPAARLIYNCAERKYRKEHGYYYSSDHCA